MPNLAIMLNELQKQIYTQHFYITYYEQALNQTGASFEHIEAEVLSDAQIGVLVKQFIYLINTDPTLNTSHPTYSQVYAFATMMEVMHDN